MSWLVRLRVPSSQLDLVSSQLWASGTTGIAEMGSENGNVIVVAGYATEQQASAAAADLTSFDAVAEKVAPWPTPEPTTITRGGLNIEIDAGMAFGHGAHPTTELALDLLLTGAIEGPVLDVGCGSGVLAIAAALAGAERVVAIDIDPVALKQTQANAERNGVSIEISSVDPADLIGLFDVVVANMLPVELEPLAPKLVSCLSPTGRIIVSGFLTGHHQRIAGFFPGRSIAKIQEHGDWGALLLT